MSDETKGIQSRKAEHLEICETDQVAFVSKSTLLEEVELIHDALPELHVDEVDIRCEFAGKTLAAPLLIAAMTGGIEEAETINRDLAAVAEKFGIGFGFGSQRPLLENPKALGYQVRDLAPTTLILGNIGIVQARESTSQQLAELVRHSGADALCVHLNPAMEVIQAGGDMDFRGGLDTLSRLLQDLEVPLVVKETGCGLSRGVGLRLADIGIKWVDCSGAGGTSWVGVETLRARSRSRAIGERFWDWGIPTAASVAQLSGLGLGICATGGVANGLSVARAIALGARCGGVARPLLQAHASGGRPAVEEALSQIIEEIRLAHLLCGARNPVELARKPVVLGPRLSSWVPEHSPLADRV